MNMTVVNVSDIVESNGNTIRQNNMNKQHTIPLGSLVEIQRDDNIDALAAMSPTEFGLKVFEWCTSGKTERLFKSPAI